MLLCKRSRGGSLWHLRPLSIAPATILRTIKPANSTKLANANLRFDFPENFVGVVQIRLSAQPVAGSEISVHHGEVLHDDGSVRFPWKNDSMQTVHILSDELTAGDLLFPRFTWHGFQYAEFSFHADSGFDGSLVSVTGLQVGPSIKRIGEVSFGGGSDAEILGSLQRLVVASQISNLAAYIPIDCPTREKRGWMADAMLSAEEAMFNYDMALVYTNFLQMVEDDQCDVGYVGDEPTYVPSTAGGHWCGAAADISWSSAYPLIARWMLRYYGDLRVAARHWESMKAYVDGLTNHASTECMDGLADFFKFGDWMAREKQDIMQNGTGPELAAFHYILSLDAMTDMAASLAASGVHGAEADAARYAALAQQFRPIFHRRFFNASARAYGAHELELQTLTVAPLALGGVVPDKELPAVLASLVHNIEAHDDHQTVGAIGAKHLFQQLSAHGLHDKALAVATQRTFPSFGNWVENGATTCWEAYDIEPDHPWTHGWSSLNHIFLCACVGEWMYKSVAGISPASDGYDRISLAPNIMQAPGSGQVRGPARATAKVTTIRGPAKVTWDATRSGVLTLGATLPVSSTATLILPLQPLGADASEVVVQESGVTVWEAGAFTPSAGVKAGRALGTSAIQFDIASGAYAFTATYKATTI